MMGKILNRGTVWALLLISLVFLNKSAYPEEKENFKPRFSIKLAWGGCYKAIGDVNRCLESLNDKFDFARSSDPESITGEIIKLNNYAPDFEGELELRIDISRRFAVSLATSGFFHRKNESSISYSWKVGDEEHTNIYSTEPEIKAWVPVKLGIYFNFPFTSKINFFSTAGIGYYSAKASEYRRLDLIRPSGRSGWISRYWETNHEGGLGVHSGIGMEYSLTKNLALTVEAQGTYAKIKNLKGTSQKEGKNSEGIDETSGTLYYFIWDVEGRWFGEHLDLDIRENRPGGGFGIHSSSVRKAVLDLSGFSLRIGIRIKLF